LATDVTELEVVVKLAQRKVARVVFDEAHNEAWSIDPVTASHMQPAHPADSSYARAAAALADRDFVVRRNLEPLSGATLAHADVLVIAHPSDAKWEHTPGTGAPVFGADEIAAVREFVRAGGGLIVLGETEQDKYGNNVNTLLAEFGLTVQNATLTDHLHCDRNVPSWVFADLAGTDSRAAFGLTEGVASACFLRAGAIASVNGAKFAARASDNASIANAGLIAAERFGAGRVVVVADSDLFGDDDLDRFDHRALWLNLCYFAAEGAFARAAVPSAAAADSADWLALKAATNALRALQQPDGALNAEADRAEATRLVAEMSAGIGALTDAFAHQAAYLAAVRADLARWVDGGFARPDFGPALTEFRPELSRKDGIEHLVVFPMYTPNGSLETRFEALIVRVPWPEWLAELERTRFDNAKFVPVHLVDYTNGYDSECAVLFPETVAVAGKAANTFGGIFCDREAKRYQRTVGKAVELLNVNAQPDLRALLASADLSRDMFVLWDLIHDRWHSHGELPFDPFMIRQRLPYWMYSLEELRCDLQTFGSAAELERDGFAFARYVKYGILFDRIVRFPITGSRVRNYDGLSGQLLFAFLHKQGVLAWRDNALTIEWGRLDASVAELRDRIEQLYRDGIDMTKVQYWIAAHEMISAWVKPNLGSQWAMATRVLSDESDTKAWINRVLDDEFPLSLWYLQLQKKIQAAGAI
jgi:hypothetical protein